MTLENFINEFIVHNTLIRLWYKDENSNFYVEADGIDKPKMEHELVKTKFKNKEVIGITDILYERSPYIEAVNIVIERD